MSAVRGLAVHGGLLVAGAVAALAMWTKDEKPAEKQENQVEVWRGSEDKVEKIVFESEKRTVTAEARKDKLGRYYVVSLDKQVTPPSHPPKRLPDGGLKKADPPKEPAKREQKTFVAVKAANELAKSLAPLMATRSVGKIEDSRAEEFGFHENKGTVTVTIGGTQNSLTLGGSTPGGADRYVKDATGAVFVVPGAIARDLETAETRLIERSLHEFEKDDVRRVKLTAGESIRELVRTGTGKGAHWTNPGSPSEQDETAQNWMSKVGRLRVTEYIAGSKDDKPGDDLVVRIDYFGDSGAIGYLELVKVPASAAASAATPPKDEYIARTEHTRWFAKVTRSIGEQVAQDVGSVVK